MKNNLLTATLLACFLLPIADIIEQQLNSENQFMLEHFTMANGVLC